MTSWLAQTVPFADAWSMHDGDVGFGWWLLMTLGMIVFWGAIIAVVVWVLRGGPSSNRPSSAPPTDASPREILDRRLAEGAIEVEEYERRRRLLDDEAGHARATREPTALGADR